MNTVQGLWLVACALARGRRYTRKQEIRQRLSTLHLVDSESCISLDDYIQRREARLPGGED
ncbi:hypothetical protein [Deinococcus multiflagellatus]|uniref:Uncharacterized protein n=1 Tax=Deinococcus multiflagellatus TaxID=1656887 RepID=A0ABW1ZEU4_9DEIO|nr:hypothetical protein [Deinococcus multiflagellatus]MBZ9712213.1 hypothetical protein [Deinococcus multiflagellatus]